VLSEVTPDVLTTYAGLLLRDLLDYFNDNVSLAVGAYNGGPANPNMKYEAGVRAAAEHARNILEQAAALNGETVMERQWIAPRSGSPR
jgi:soluble lytic murein transglycosylase-like protein